MLITPTAFVAKYFPDKPPQFAYALLKQGMPSQQVVQTLQSKDKTAKPNPATGAKPLKTKERPMVDEQMALAWYNDYIATQTPRKCGTHSPPAPLLEVTTTNADGSVTKSIIRPQAHGANSTDGSSGPGLRANRKGQLLTYQRVPGLATVAQIRKGDAVLVNVSTVHGDGALDNLNTKYEYPFLPEALKAAIRKQKIILDHPRRVIEYAIESLKILPLQLDDRELADKLEEVLRNYPYQRITATNDREDDPEPTALELVEKQLEYEEGEEDE